MVGNNLYKGLTMQRNVHYDHHIIWLRLSCFLVFWNCYPNEHAIFLTIFFFFFFFKKVFSIKLHRLRHLKYILFHPNIDQNNYKIDKTNVTQPGNDCFTCLQILFYYDTIINQTNYFKAAFGWNTEKSRYAYFFGSHKSLNIL